MHESLSRVAAEIHAGRIIDRGNAASAPDRHGLTPLIARRHLHEALGNWPVGDARGFLHAFDESGTFRGLTMRLHIAVAIGIEDAELDGVHADEPGELVHLR